MSAVQQVRAGSLIHSFVARLLRELQLPVVHFGIMSMLQWGMRRCGCCSARLSAVGWRSTCTLPPTELTSPAELQYRVHTVELAPTLGSCDARVPLLLLQRDASMGRGDSPSRNWNALQDVLLLRVSALWMSSTVTQIDNAREAQLSMRALQCCAHFSGLLPSWRAVMDRRRLAAMALHALVAMW